VKRLLWNWLAIASALMFAMLIAQLGRSLFARDTLFASQELPSKGTEPDPATWSILVTNRGQLTLYIVRFVTTSEAPIHVTLNSTRAHSNPDTGSGIWRIECTIDKSGGSPQIFARVPIWFLAMLFAIPAMWRFRSLRERRDDCRACGYDLTGNKSGVCPECGTRTVGEVMP